jgi:hypothetical protein
MIQLKGFFQCREPSPSLSVLLQNEDIVELPDRIRSADKIDRFSNALTGFSSSGQVWHVPEHLMFDFASYTSRFVQDWQED